MSAEQERLELIDNLLELHTARWIDIETDSVRWLLAQLRQAQEREAALRKLLIESNHYTEKELAESLTTQDSEA